MATNLKPNTVRPSDKVVIQKQTCEDLDKEVYGEKPVCIACASENITIYWESRYNGFRGTCNDCNTNWAES